MHYSFTFWLCVLSLHFLSLYLSMSVFMFCKRLRLTYVLNVLKVTVQGPCDVQRPCDNLQRNRATRRDCVLYENNDMNKTFCYRSSQRQQEMTWITQSAGTADSSLCDRPWTTQWSVAAHGWMYTFELWHRWTPIKPLVVCTDSWIAYAILIVIIIGSFIVRRLQT